MKKIFIISVIVCSTLFAVGCGQSNKNLPTPTNITVGENDQNDSSISEDTNNPKTDKTEISNSTNSTDDKNATSANTSKKNYYLKKLDDIQAKIDKDYNDKDLITTQDMRRANDAKYKLWDDALNEIYKDVQNALSTNNKEKLKQEELAWISKKESDAKNDSKEMEGGTLEPVIYSGSLAESTKKRCYELVNEYYN